MQDSAPERLQTDTLHSLMQSLHYAGGNAMDRLASAANAFFSNPFKDGGYGGSQQGDGITGSGITIRETPGTKVIKNLDGSTTVVKTNERGTNQTVIELDEHGNIVETKLMTIERNDAGDLFHRTQNSDGSASIIKIAEAGASVEGARIFYNSETGVTSVISSVSGDEFTKNVVHIDQHGEVEFVEYKYEVLLDGSVVEYEVNSFGDAYTHHVVSPGQTGIAHSELQMLDNGTVVATTVFLDGTRQFKFVSAASDTVDRMTYEYELRADGAVIEKVTDYGGEIYQREVISAVQNGQAPVMHVGSDGALTFIQTKEDGSKTLHYISAHGSEGGESVTYETHADGSCTVKYVNNETGAVQTGTILAPSEGAGVPMVKRGQNGQVLITSYQEDGSVIEMTVGADGFLIDNAVRTSYEYFEGGYKVKREYLDDDGEYSGGSTGTIILGREGWSDMTDDVPSSSDNWDAIYGTGGLWDNWERQMEWSLYGSSRYNVNDSGVQTVGDSDWSGWQENGGTIERKLIDLSGSGTYNGTQQNFRVKSAGAENDSLQGGADMDMFYAGAGNDTLNGAGGSDLLSGEDGNDALYGDDGNDKLYGGNGSDSLYGGNGNDYMDDALAGTTDGLNVSGNDLMDGGDGNDEMHGRAGSDTLEGATGNDYLTGDAGDDVLTGGAGDDNIDGGENNDYIDGGDGNDLVAGSDGNDIVLAGYGDDTLIGGLGADTLVGGEGRDRAYYGFATSYLTIDLSNNRGTGGEAEGDVLEGIEEVWGGRFGNTMIGNEADNYLLGGEGADLLTGNGGKDTLFGGAGLDTVWGGDGVDWLYGSYGDDQLHGGNDDDKLWGMDQNDTLWGDDGSDALDGGKGNDWLYGGTGDDKLLGDEGNDSLIGEDGTDTLVGGVGADSLNGGNGNDNLQGNEGNDMLSGGNDQDNLEGGADNDTLNGDAGFDWLYGGTGNDVLYGGTGSDQLFGEDGDDQLYGEDGIDGIIGGLGNDYIFGGADFDSLDGSQGNDTVYGGLGDDKILGGDNEDRLDGNEGNDWVYGGNGQDVMYGGSGHDWLYGEEGDDQLFGEDGVDGIIGGVGNDYIFGGADYDSLEGSQGNDTIYGGLGDDKIFGGDNDDRLDGNEGNDTIYGGFGNDVLFGGSGNDVFVFNGMDGSDRIKDFGYGDIIRLTGVTQSYASPLGGYNKPVTITNYDPTSYSMVTATKISTTDGREIIINNVRAEQLKGGVVNGAWEWHL